MGQALHFPRHHDSCLLVLALVVLQAPLWLNPGYFSHDELQWAMRANVATLAELPWVSFLAWDHFQFRPLTFNLWLLLSHALFDTPRIFHAVCVLLGSLNALLLARVLGAAGAGPRSAWLAALVFGLSPYAAWVHGWVGCLADLLWVGAGLALVRLLQQLGPDRRGLLLAGTGALLATGIGLLAKEAALSLPALLVLATVLLRWPRHWLVASVVSLAVATIYLALRLPVLLHPGEGSTYLIHASAIPRRWLEYQVFAWALGINEPVVLALAPWLDWSLWLVLLLGLIVTVWRASRRLWLAWFAGGVLALAPVLVLPSAYNQYGYGFIAVSAATLVLAVPRMGRGGRILVLVLALFTLLHGFQVQREILRVGHLQRVFSPSLDHAMQAAPGVPIRLWPEMPEQRHVYQRLSLGASARAEPGAAPSVRMAETEATASHRITADGTVRAVRVHGP